MSAIQRARVVRLKQNIFRLFLILFCLIFVEQPLLASSAQAAVGPTSSNQNAQEVTAAENDDTSVTNLVSDWNETTLITNAVTPVVENAKRTDPNQPPPRVMKGVLGLSADDQNRLNICLDPTKQKDCVIDTRLTNYLLYLVTPVDLGGAGFSNIQAQIYKGYDTSGIGKYDRETLAANLEDPSQISPHNNGQAVNITAAGTITCKLVEHRIIGGHTTHWQPAMPVKIAWQSPSGIANNPVPTGDSLTGVAGTLTAGGIVDYLNSTGEMDAYIDYAKGLDIGTIAEYVGANILLKTTGSAQVQFDPLAGSVLGTVGAATLQKVLAGTPVNLGAHDPNGDIRIDAAKAQIEDGLGLPAGSLSSSGWDHILTNTGKRLLEQDLGLPIKYLDSHNWQDVVKSDQGKAMLTYVTHNDSAFNFIPDTISALQKNDPRGIKMAAVNIITKAFKLSDDQKKILTEAIKNNQQPNLDSSGLNTGGQLSVDGLAGWLSGDPAKAKATEAELKNIGIALFRKAAQSAVPSQYSGLTQSLLNSLLNPSQTISLKDVTNQLGANTLFAATGLDPKDVANFIAHPGSTSKTTAELALGLNTLLGLTGKSSLTSSDIASMFSDDFSSWQKIGGGELDRAFHWNDGTGLAVISDPSKLTDAVKETLANNIAQLLGLTQNQFTINDTTGADYGVAVILQRFGLGGFNSSTDASALLKQIGTSQFADLFGLTNLNPANWDDDTLNQLWATDDANLGVPAGTIKAFLRGEVSAGELIKAVGEKNLAALGAQQLWDQLGITGAYAPKDNDFKTLITYFQTGTGGDKVLDLVTNIVGRSVDSHADFSVDDFSHFIAAKNDQQRVTAILDTGLRVLGHALGANLSGYNEDQLDNIMKEVKGIYNDGLSALDPRSPIYQTVGQPLINFFVQATGVPKDYTDDALTFLTGDYRIGLSALSFQLWQKEINPYLPADDQLTYAELRDTIGVTDPAAIQAEVDMLTNTVDENGNPISVAPTPEVYDQARQELNHQAVQNVQYKMADSFLRKIDPSLPAGFTKAMMTGTDAERTQILEDFAFNKFDDILRQINPAYVPGSLEKIFTGEIDSSQAVLTLFGVNGSVDSIPGIVTKTGVSLGPLNSTDIGNLIGYFAAPKANQNLLTDQQFNQTWSNLDQWLTTTLGLGTLPDGVSKSIYYASQNGWDFNASLKDANGNVVIQSLNNLASDFATSKLTAWADKELHMPVGSVYQIYKAVKAVVAGSQALALAHAAGDAAKIASASKSLSTAQASLTVLAITTALQACAACQQLFSSIDAALHAPPGFTNAAVAGAIAAAFGLGFVGLYIAAAIYLFGVNSVSYECPLPPNEQYALTAYDQGADELSYGFTPGVDGPAPPSANPAPGQNPFDWDNNVPFTTANPKVWEGWARYYTGMLLQATMNYGQSQIDFNKPLQVLTYRQANVEYFTSQVANAFGAAEQDNPRVGLGYTQDTTHTTDYVYVSFGGYY